MLKRILLLKAWGEFVKGDVVEVDELRAARLIEDGTGMLDEQALLRGDPTAAPPAGVIDARSGGQSLQVGKAGEKVTISRRGKKKA